MTEEAQVIYMGEATGPTAEMQAVAPWISGGFGLVLLSFVLYFAFATFLAVKRQVPGRWLTVSGLSVVMVYFVFQNTLAQDAELRYGPFAFAIALLAYGAGGIMAAVGYALLVIHVCRENSSR